MSVYRFKVIIEDYEDLFREIEVKSNQSFEDLHFAILKAFGFDLKHPASIFYSDDLWHMEDEIAFKDMPYSLVSNGIPMISTKLSQYIDDPHQRFIYIYQSNEDAWAFLLELVSVGSPASDEVILPRVVKAEGEAPKQYNPKAALTAKPGSPSAVPTAAVEAVPSINDDQEPDAEDLQEDQLFEQIETMGKSRKSSSLDLAGTGTASEIPDGFVLDDDSDSGLSDNEDDDNQDRDDDNDDNGDDDDYRGGGRGRSGDYDQGDY